LKLLPIFTLSRVQALFKDVYFLLVLTVCAGLVLFKLDDFLLPYFSDELWVYGPSIRKMGSEIPSMLPSSLALEDHWAHPMLFFFLGGIWCFVFGTSILSTHVFAAFLSISLIVIIYLFGKKIFNREVGFYSVLIFGFQTIFHGQFLLVLPEVLLTIFTFLTIYFYWKGKNISYLCFAICLVLTKESGVFLIVAIGIWELIKDCCYDKKKFSFQIFAKKYLLIGLPLAAIGLHILLLKYTYGWFVLPIRLEHFEFSWNLYRERIMSSAHYVFIGQGRKPIILVLFVGAIFFHKRYPIWMRIIVLVVSFSMMKVFFKYWVLPDLFIMITIPVLFIVFLKLVFLDVYKTDKKRGGVISLFVIFITLYLLFSSAQFDSLRYLLCIVPIYIIIGLYFTQKIFLFKELVLPVVSIIIISFSIFYNINDLNYGDDTNNYSNDCKIRFDAVKFIEDNYKATDRINTSFLFQHALYRPLSGYLSTNKVFTNMKSENSVDEGYGVFVFCNMEPSEYYEGIKDNKELKIVQRFEQDNIWVEIYVKK